MGDRLLRIRDLKEKVPLGRTTIWRKERVGEFPARRDLGGGVVGWLESEVDQWIASRPALHGTIDSGHAE